MSLFAFLSWLCRNRGVTRGATPVSHGRGPLNAPPASRSRGAATQSAGLPSDATHPDATHPDATHPDATHPDATHPDATHPGQDTTQPEQDASQTAAISAAAAAQAPAENFPVALRMLPARYRRHLMAVYRFARTVDDIGDEALPGATGGPVTGNDEVRLRLLDELEADLIRLYAGQTPGSEVIAQLAPTVSECGVPASLFQDLIQANRQDQQVTRYQTFDDLVGYCKLSANPVGRIVLYVFGSFTPERASLSDHVCTALQLAEHWQDVAEDYRNGRIYLPGEDLETFGCGEQDLAEPSASPKIRELMTYEVVRAGALLDAGSPLIGSLHRAAKVAVAGYVAGGRAALAAIEAADYDVLAATRHPNKRRLLAELAKAYLRGR
jgi:squalene synthase HpnC